MGFWEDIQAGWSNFVDWLGGIGQSLSDTYGQLGQGIFSGLAWLGEKIKDALEWMYKGLAWLGDKLWEGLKTLGSYASQGLQWIGSGLTWVGEQLYNFGTWLYNGIISTLHWVLRGLGTIFNWIATVLSSIWNALCGIPNTFVSGFNAFFTSMVVGFREKFKMLFFVNTAIPSMGHQLEAMPKMFAEKPSFERLIGTVGGLILAPIASYAVAEVLDSVIPTPHTEPITLFPALELPEWTAESAIMDVPEEETAPVSPGYIPPTAPEYNPTPEAGAGVGTSYEVKREAGRQGWADSGVGTSYEVTLE